MTLALRHMPLLLAIALLPSMAPAADPSICLREPTVRAETVCLHTVADMLIARAEGLAPRWADGVGLGCHARAAQLPEPALAAARCRALEAEALADDLGRTLGLPDLATPYIELRPRAGSGRAGPRDALIGLPPG